MSEKISLKEELSPLSDVEEALQEPPMFRVLLLNDNYTTMDFVVKVLMDIFHKNLIEATKIMLDVHRKGRGMVGVYTFDIANTKVAQVHSKAKESQFPLRCSLEPA